MAEPTVDSMVATMAAKKDEQMVEQMAVRSADKKAGQTAQS